MRAAQQVIYQNKDFIQGALIIGGWDPYKGSQLYNVTLGGSVFKTDNAWSGSGSVFISGLLKKEYHPNMTKAQITDFLRSAISLATYRDTSSGGNINMMCITANGAERTPYFYNEHPYK